MNEPRLPEEPPADSDAETVASSLQRGRKPGAEEAGGDSSHDETLGAQDVSFGSAGGPGAPPPGSLPEVFASYRLVRELHRGGQGVVYLAMQQTTRRKVAIKVMKEGPFGGPHDRARFEREVHILGQLNHPSIVAIHESGIVAGNHYFVMDYISGQPLDEYMRSGKHSPRATLELFARICEAVNAAHIRGIIHRDLKPGNIRIDPEGNPHVLDFGLAKTLSGDPDSDMITMTGQFMGSLPWASPEQAEAIPSKIDIRTDVYSLGVILYQMLTGKLPYRVAGSVSDAISNIRNAAPARPSTIQKWINNEVETIVLKCMAKERERRYQTAGELERDVRRYLRGEPIEAKRDSAWYVLSKTLRRYRGRAAVGMAFLVLLVGLAATMTFAYERVSDAYERVSEEARKARLVAGFLDGILTSVDPDIARQGFDSPLHQALRETVDGAAARIDELQDEPEVQARVRNTIGRVYMNLGLYPEARQQFEHALDSCRQLYGERHAATAESLYLLGGALKETAAHADSERAYQDALALRRELFGDDNLAVAETLNGLGQLYFVQRDYQAAEPPLREALEIRRRHAGERDIATSLANLGSLLRDTQRLDEAEPLLREALEMRQRLFGDNHFHTVVSMNKLGLLLRQQGRTAEARDLFERALESRRQLVGENHPHVGASLNNLGLALMDEGLYAEAARSFAAAVEIWRETLAPDDPRIATALVNHATCLREAGDYPAAMELCRQALDQLPPDSPQRAEATLALAAVQIDAGQPAAAEAALRELVEQSRELFPPDHPLPALATGELGRCLASQGCFEEAEGLLLAAQQKIESIYGPDAPRTAESIRQIVSLYELWDRPEEADRYRALLPAGFAE